MVYAWRPPCIFSHLYASSFILIDVFNKIRAKEAGITNFSVQPLNHLPVSI